MNKPVTLIAVVVFSLIALLQLLRVVLGWEVTIHGVVVPMWVSFSACAVAGGLAVMLWRETR